MNEDRERIMLPWSRSCFVCGEENERGMRARSYIAGDWIELPFTAPPSFAGWRTVIHGGLVATLLDEAMGWAARVQGLWTMTARMQVRFRQPVPLSRRLRITGRVTNRRQRLVEVRAELRDDAGTLLAEGEGSLFRVTPKQGQEIEQAYRAAEAARGAPS